MIGERFGPYSVVKEIGRGGMGAVYLAEHQLIGRRAAIKVLQRDCADDPELVDRFFNEARSAGRLRHPGIVDVIDYGHTADGRAFLVMEFLEGESLYGKLRREPRPPLLEVVGIGRQIASAVGAAHEHNIVHRDLKPDNVYLVRDEESAIGLRVKVLDFGIAKLLGDEITLRRITRSSAILGTPMYMSPEQCRGAGFVDHRSDIYSLGCILYRMACGRVPFPDLTPQALFVAHEQAPPPPPRTLVPTLPAALERTILRALEKDPDRRFQSMAELSASLSVALEAAADELAPTIGRPIARTPLPAPRATIAGVAPMPRAGMAAPLVEDAAPSPDPSPVPSPAPSPGTPPIGLESGRSRVPSTAAVSPAPLPARSRPLAAAVAIALGIAASASLVLALARGPSPRGRAPVEESPADRAPAPAAPAPAPAAVHLRIDSDPSGAGVFREVDGVRVGETPFLVEVPLAPGVASYFLRLPHYQVRKVELPTDRDGSVRVPLDRLKPAPIKPAAQKPAVRLVDPFAQ